MILISGCQDNQTSLDGDHNGAFTEQLLRVWNQRPLHRATTSSSTPRIKARLPATQTPNLFTLGPAAAFLAAEAFQRLMRPRAPAGPAPNEEP